MSRKNYILVDFENRQDVDLDLLDEFDFEIEVVIFFGSQHKSVPMKIAQALSGSRPIVRIVHCQGSGKNYLDMQLACYCGKLAAKEEQIFVHLVTGDKDADSIVDWLKEQRIPCVRSDNFEALPFLVKREAVVPTSDLCSRAIEWLRTMGSSRPKKQTTLKTALRAAFPKEVSEESVVLLLQELVAKKAVGLKPDGFVEYKLLPNLS